MSDSIDANCVFSDLTFITSMQLTSTISHLTHRYRGWRTFCIQTVVFNKQSSCLYQNKFLYMFARGDSVLSCAFMLEKALICLTSVKVPNLIFKKLRGSIHQRNKNRRETVRCLNKITCEMLDIFALKGQTLLAKHLVC